MRQPSAAEKPAMGTIKLEADTKVALTDRLVSFQQMKITEANFQTLPKEQVREISDGDRQGDSRRRARDRARSRARESRQEPDRSEERRGHQGRSPDDLLQQDARGDREHRRRADLEPDQGQRSEVSPSTRTGTCSSTARRSTFYLRNNDTWLKATDVKGPWTPAGKLPGSFTKLPAEENWKDVKANLPGKADRGVGGAEGVRRASSRRS